MEEEIADFLQDHFGDDTDSAAEFLYNVPEEHMYASGGSIASFLADKLKQFFKYLAKSQQQAQHKPYEYYQSR